MDNLFNKTTLIELAITSLMFYFLPKTSVILYGIPIVTKYYSNRLLKSSPGLDQKKMKAVLYTYGSDYAFEEISIPKFGPNDVLVKVRGSAINPVDYKVRTPSLPFIRWFFPHTVGRDFSGIIVDVGENVKNFHKGDDVYGNASGGSLQEYTVARASQIATKPRNITYVESASIALAGATSYQSLKWFKKPTSQDKILIIGASGGCGSLGVQIAKTFGSQVYGVCSTSNLNFVKSLGTDKIIDYRQPNYLDELKNEKFDIIYDTVTSKDDPDQELIFAQFLKPNGFWVAINGSPVNFARSFLKFEKRSNFHIHLLNWNTEDLEYLRTLIEEGKLKPLGCESLNFSKETVADAFARLESRRTVGKIGFEI